jgi:tetratricopeptide (TPR) repeat protein
MFSFLPELLIVLSLAGIIAIVLRKIPGVQEFVSKTPLPKLPVHGARAVAVKIRDYSVVLGKKFWQFLLEVKETSKTGPLAKLPSKFSKIHIPRPNLKFLRPSESAEFYLSQAQDSLDKEAFEEAERKFIKVIEKDPHNEEAYAGLGRLYLSQKKFEEAIETYKFLLKSHPANDNYHSSLGQAYHGQKLYDQAMSAYETAIEMAPENAKRYVNLGLTLEARKHFAEAILNYRKALDLEKNNAQFMMVLAEALVKKGDKEEAKIFLEQILQLEPTNHLARERLMQLKF